MMKVIVTIAFFVLAGSVQAQSLKEALYGGRLKNDTGAVIKKTDTLQIRENMAKKVADDSVKKAEAVAKKEAIATAIAAGDTATARVLSTPPPETVASTEIAPAMHRSALADILF